MSPFGAAELEGKTIEAKVLNEHWKRWEEYPVDIVLVEGIGGVMCPLAPKFTYLDWIRDKKCPALLVSKVGLGSLNQALLSLSALERAEVEVLGLLPNQEQYFPSVDPISGSFCSEMKQMTDIHLFSMQVRDMMKGGSSDRHKGEAREGEHESLEQQVGQISNPIQEIAERFLERF
jgi:dethiobiotin synthetase